MCSLRPVIAILFLFAPAGGIIYPSASRTALCGLWKYLQMRKNILVELAAYYAMRYHESTLAVCLKLWSCRGSWKPLLLK